MYLKAGLGSVVHRGAQAEVGDAVVGGVAHEAAHGIHAVGGQGHAVGDGDIGRGEAEAAGKLVKVSPTCPFTQYLPEEFELPSAHAEGRLVCEPGDAQKYMDAGCVALQYADNHNGSELRIAGLQDPTGRAMGLMPHPERFLRPQHHYDPDWSGDSEWGWGYYFFKGAFDALK